MRITALGKPFYNYPKNTACNQKALTSALRPASADIFCFKGGDSLADKIGIIPSSTPTPLEKKIESNLGITPTKTVVKRFANGETYVNIAEPVRGKDVYLMPVGGNSVNDNLMETYLKADAAKRAGADKVIAVLPSFDYARQERKTESGEAIAAKVNMDLLRASGVDEIITTDLHATAIQGFVSNDMRITHLESMELMKNYIEEQGIEDIVVVSPDLGGTKRVDKLAKALDCDKAIIYKHRAAHNQATAEDLIGDVEGKNCIIFDDMIDTAGTIAEASKMLKKHGAKDIYVCAAHGLFNGPAMQRLNDAPIKEIIVTNSMPQKANKIDKIKEVDLSVQIAEAMKSISA